MAAAMLASIMTDNENDHHLEKMGTKDLLNLMPDRNDILLSSELEKCPFFSPGSNWRPLFCATTKDVLFMAKDANDFVIDRIPLFEVADVKAKGAVKEGGHSYYIFELYTIQVGSRAALCIRVGRKLIVMAVASSSVR